MILIKERWGSGVVEQLSLDMQRDFPDADGFSVSNLWFMKKWYCFYTRKGANQILYQAGRELVKSKSSRSDSEKLQQPVRELDEAKSSRFDREKLQQPVAELEVAKMHQVGAEMPAFFADVPWGHHIAIITKCKSVDELLKAPEDNPTIGLLICSNMDSTDVQWSFRGLGTPMGVATYNNIRIKDALPSKELLEERMRLLQKEMHTTKQLIRKKGD